MYTSLVVVTFVCFVYVVEDASSSTVSADADMGLFILAVERSRGEKKPTQRRTDPRPPRAGEMRTRILLVVGFGWYYYPQACTCRARTLRKPPKITH